MVWALKPTNIFLQLALAVKLLLAGILHVVQFSFLLGCSHRFGHVVVAKAFQI